MSIYEFSSYEKSLFDVAINHFSRPENIERYSIFKTVDIRFENWFQSELIYAWFKKGIYLTCKGKINSDVDVITIKPDGTKLGVELRITRSGSKSIC